ncbi:MAG: VWA-like domain-containing protein [Marinifilaceae bacterium]|jgi:predicted metal-dependent peptidase|nr:VWA-like domain-containing protein [Marinifilaceae bacterium]
MKHNPNISQISTRILLKEPFYGHFILGVPKLLDKEIETACVSLFNKNNIKLSINPDFFNSLAEQKKMGLIKHEILHIVFKHLFTFKQYTNKALYNIAADLAINQYIPSTELPEGAVQLEHFTYTSSLFGFELKSEESTHYYYQQLLKILQLSSRLNKSDISNCRGNYIDLNKLLDQANSNQEKHKSWTEFEKLEQSEVKILEYQLHNQLKQLMQRVQFHSNLIGKLPAQIILQINLILNEYKEQIDWKRVLKSFANSSTKTYIKNTLRRPSKRYGTTPGIKINNRNKLLVAIDSSGSVPPKDIELFFCELHQIWKKKAEVIITECDAEIQKTYVYNGKIPKSVCGRGGTNFTPPINLANKEIKPDGIIYFTDGFAHPPSLKSRCPILWVISSNGISEKDSIWNQLKGKKVKITRQ